MRKMRIWLRAAALAATVALAFGWASPAWAPNCPCETTSLKLSLAGSFFFPPFPCVTAGEAVALTGEVHVVTVVAVPPGPNTLTADIYLNMAGVSGPGQTTGSLYIGTGANKLVGVTIPPGPNVFSATFTLEPTNGCASVPLPLRFMLDFGTDGTLLSDSTVSVGVT